jgi:hypothetical protein
MNKLLLSIGGLAFLGLSAFVLGYGGNKTITPLPEELPLSSEKIQVLNVVDNTGDLISCPWINGSTGHVVTQFSQGELVTWCYGEHNSIPLSKMPGNIQAEIRTGQ